MNVTPKDNLHRNQRIADLIALTTRTLRRTAGTPLRLGDLIATTFDQAVQVTRDPKKAAELATFIVQKALRNSGNYRLLSQLASATPSATNI